ncbi:unnamed protein product [Oppiella nova]|uniref:Uncharacterized protein n=1 Tax=Oppiella nova TaxID=334625 RepID=A0A7R9LMU3_9ACAR|nr:unnamed protein product [Oppiella nova]CAG2165168.1 unnamed protein product [Oppiella nova]
MAERCKRCVNEHRTIRKELSKWHKNVALLCDLTFDSLALKVEDLNRDIGQKEWKEWLKN